MLKNFFPTALLIFVVVFFACKQNKPAGTGVGTVYVPDSFNYNYKKCVKDSICVEVTVHIPLFKGADLPPALAAINDSLQALARYGAGDYGHLPLKQALDSTGENLFNLLKSDDFALRLGGFNQNVTGKITLQTPKIVSVAVDAGGYTGGAHGYYATALATYTFSNGKSVPLTEVVRDTAALVPLLEKGFLADKNSEEPEASLQDLLFPEYKNLPVTSNYCIEKEGLRFFYNPYEVAPWAVGGTDILLSWEELGALADRKRWVE